MALLQGLFDFLSSHPYFIVLGVVAYTVIFYVSTLFAQPKPGRNPFYGDSRKHPQPLVHEKAVRDKVLKQGFTSKRIPDSVDVIVIGSGIAGLTTAALLAKAEKKVLVLEQHDQAGGCCHTFVEKGFEFDVGIHYIGEMENRTLGRTLLEQISDGQIQWAPLDKNFDTIIIGDKRYPLRSGKNELRQSLIDSFPEEVEAIDQFFAMLKKARKNFMYFAMLKTLPKRFTNLLVKLKVLDLFTEYTKLANTTTKQFTDSITNNPDLKAVFAYSFGDYGTSPAHSSILMQAMLFNHYTYSASYPVGGASEIAFHIIPVIERHGGKVLVRANVSDIICEKGRAVGVTVVKGDEKHDIRAKTIVSATGLYNTMKMLPPELHEKLSFKSLVDQKDVQSGVGAFSLFVGLKGTTQELGLKAQNIWAFTNADLDGCFHGYLNRPLDLDNSEEIPLLFISFPSTKDPTWEERYPEKSVCTVVTLTNYEWFKEWDHLKVKHRGDEYERLKEHFSRQMWNQVLKLYPQLEDKVEYMELGTPVTNNYYIRSTKGEIYGIDHEYKRFDPAVASKLRPSSGVPGLYLSGQDILLCGLSGGMFSGLLTASAILHRNLFDDCTKLNNQIRKKERAAETALSEDSSKKQN